ncbi:MAG TPA: GNAT family N-acetyltransferase [Allosphingosinicella sp.]|jgi:putative acetyltransferase
MLDIRQDDLRGADVRALLAYHRGSMHAASPPGTVFALDLGGLEARDVTVWSAWDGTTLAGVAALRQVDHETGEIKSMRTHPAQLRRGVAAALLEHLIEQARARGWRRLSLETGSGPAFAAALALYRRRGFVEGQSFGGYADSPFNRFLHLPLA